MLILVDLNFAVVLKDGAQPQAVNVPQRMQTRRAILEQLKKLNRVARRYDGESDDEYR